MPSQNQLPQVILPRFDGAIADAARQKLDAARLEVIRNDADYEVYANKLKDAKARLAILESGYEQHATPLNRAIKAVREFWKPAVEIIADECRMRARALGDYHNLKRQQQRAAQMAADQAAERERRALEARAAKAEDKGNTEKAIALAQQASTTIAPVIRTDPPKVSGQSLREVWLFVIEDPALLPREYTTADEQKIRRYVNAMKADARIAGVRIYSEKRVASGV